MEDNNLYAPPKSVVADVTPIKSESKVRFFAVSPVKLVVLSTCTFGLYQIYWFYKQWLLIRKHSEPDIIPWARTLFGVIWCYSCFEFIRQDEERFDVRPKLPAIPLAVGWIATTITWRLPEPYFLCDLLSPFILIPVQQHINRMNTLVAPDHDQNSRFSAWNWLAVVLGCLVLALITIGSMQQLHRTGLRLRVSASSVNVTSVLCSEAGATAGMDVHYA